MEFIDRSSWESLVLAFAACFEGLGTVVTDDRHAGFDAPRAGTGLTLNRDGSSRSFMPLHDMGARWERAAFDRKRNIVVVEGEGFSYTYRIPPSLTHD